MLVASVYFNYAGDLHYHLMDAHKRLRVPIIVSETGVSDERHVLRAQCISTYYSEVRWRLG